MKVVGIVTEYNPFHNGHKYHIEEAKKLTGADYVIAVMSGNFVQRGTPAVIDKYSRAAMALNNGVDLVLELPVCYATGSAEYFAHGAVSLLDKLGVVDALCFGSECGDISLLTKAAALLLQSPESFHTKLQLYIKTGLSYPAARVKALEHLLIEDASTDLSSLSEVLAEPNNILGIEYVKALLRLSSGITPVTIQRISAQYHDSELSPRNAQTHPDQQKYLEVCDPVISSATAIRKAIFRSDEWSEAVFEPVEQSVPKDVTDFLRTNYHLTYPITEEDFIQLLRYRLSMENSTTLASYQDITEDLARRIAHLDHLYQSYNDLAQEIKTKNITLTRVNRALIHILLNIRTTSLEEYIAQDYTPYARILGIKRESSSLLRSIEKQGRIPMITKVSKASELLNETGRRMLSEDIFASHIYNQAVYEKFGTSLPNEYRRGIVMV